MKNQLSKFSNLSVAKIFQITASSYLIVTGILISLFMEPVYYFDSPRYFFREDISGIRTEILSHSGAYIQTLLFSIFDEFTKPFIPNVIIWASSGMLLIKIISRLELRVITKVLLITFVALFYSSNIITSWTIIALSESIGISFLIVFIFATITILFLKEQNNQIRLLIIISYLLLALSKPVWAALLLPIAITTVIRFQKNRTSSLLIISFSVAATSFLALKSSDQPYENTSAKPYAQIGVSFDGWNALTRAFEFGKEDKFGEVAMGPINECPYLRNLIDEARRADSTEYFVLYYKDATANCPEITRKLNDGAFNSIPLLFMNDLEKTLSMQVEMLDALINPITYANVPISLNSFNSTFSGIFVPNGIILFPVVFVLFWSRKGIKPYLTVSTFTHTFAAILLYFQVGIEGARHVLPISLGLGFTAIIFLIYVIEIKDKLDSSVSILPKVN